MKVGIDRIGFYTSKWYVDMAKLAKARNEEPGKYLIGIGQSKQSVIPNSQDAVTMAANAADQIIDDRNRDQIDLVLFGTESGVDNSKSAAIYLQHLLQLRSNIQSVELKQACYAMTAGIQLAKDHVLAHPESKVLVIGSDIARYGLHSAGEPTQGGGAMAMIISANPKILTIEEPSAHYTADIMDFWRPLYATQAVVDGKYSSQEYIDFFDRTLTEYQAKTQTKLSDLQAIVFHLPYTKMGLKALKSVLSKTDDRHATQLLREFEYSRIFSREVGNLYTGSLYLSLLSLLVNSENLKSGQKIGLFSYGSGAEGEFYVTTLQPGFETAIGGDKVKHLLEDREELSITEYEAMFNSQMPLSADDFTTHTQIDSAKFYLAGQKDQQRQYQRRKV
ncbi:Hydroxymethylglutaryl-CoA synthase [Pediococcus damnosus]|uniref:Hydroxymethylglutaryl-CoA synthase n=1 Tax=Pediococcus damnosus TaxID=51663 RepID=A0ABM6A7F9_9LACO|nr:hydroxymethylglutaryl-CoA synthase [Pediococcus damnosus]AMV68153.1 Hydroxymethylglutaryl-CoA synthase [Pediococcus damnosus]AMV70340.1 Hydroxymethylglutaryl-CoA synthase [Pediococcus damnosus]KJU74595.1 hydroxymethylglutaryl-CoA synthase [Pediococcus damnosus LMG 28219]KRN52059.1 hydroxymethylglutaryl-CoA synthase [Pediococcus damnosus]PIO81995.1 hydroxymethylglutaryl-CoA synthase [Pediococcus damnosus]